MSTKGYFVSFEGIDGAGKTTVIDALKKKCDDQSVEWVQTREPGGSQLAESIRELLMRHVGQADVLTELLLLYAARRDHVQTCIRPWLQQGKLILCDRFFDASYAYQVAARGEDAERLGILDQWVLDGVLPDLSFFIDISIDLSKERRKHRGSEQGFDAFDGDFFNKVRKGYMQRALQYPKRIVTLQADEGSEALAERVWHTIQNRRCNWVDGCA